MTNVGPRFQGGYRIPTISVVLPVYNGAQFLREAMDSILQQSFSDFELLAIDDGSLDDSREVILSYSDPRIVFLQNKKNRGLVYTLNRGLQYARGVYIARMDQDDISLPERFIQQVKFMEQHPAIGLCGTWMETIGDRTGITIKHATDPEENKCKLLFVTVLAHPTVIFRRSILADNALRYSEDFQHAEDYEFWSRLSQQTYITNLPTILHRYRISPGQISHKYNKQQLECHIRAQDKLLRRLGIIPTENEGYLHAAISFQRSVLKREYILDAAQWLSRLQAANGECHIYPEPYFTRVLRYFWGSVCQRNEQIDCTWVRKYWQEQDAILANHNNDIVRAE